MGISPQHMLSGQEHPKKQRAERLAHHSDSCNFGMSRPFGFLQEPVGRAIDY
jgi:hypothetical protein